MLEKIGNVTLDDTWYPGEDLYSDGAVEDRLLSIAQTVPEQQLNRAIAREKDWAVLYHMSHIRENILEAIPIGKEEKVLEIGAGCGAVTGALTRRAGEVTSVDLSMRRSRINAFRHRDCDNLRILVGNYQQIEPELPKEAYDLITLIGVFEYGKAYIGSELPYDRFLEQIRTHLRPAGRLVIAIENRLGLKYWAGCREDHTGRFFEGLENYPDPCCGVRTFSRPELEQLFVRTGFAVDRFYYPYPDYKLPQEIFSDDYLPGKGQLRTNNWNFDRDRLVLFDETRVYDSLLESGVFPLFSNSYLAVVRRKDDALPERKTEPIYTKLSNERSRAYALKTQIRQDADGAREVVKTACYPEGEAHIRGMKAAEKALRELFSGSGIGVNRVLKEAPGQVHLEYLSGCRTLEETAGAKWASGDQEGAVAQIRRLTKKLSDLATVPFEMTEEFTRVFGDYTPGERERSLPVTDVDLLGENLLIGRDAQGEECWTLTDYEWTYFFPIPVRFLIYRIWHYFFARYAGCEAGEQLLAEEGIRPGDIAVFAAMEQSWQREVQRGITPLRELHGDISPGIRDLRPELGIGAAQAFAVSTLYCGPDQEHMQEEKLTAQMELSPEGAFHVSFALEGLKDTSCLRWDPAENRLCRIKIRQVSADRLVQLSPMNGFREKEGDVFWTMDPAYRVEGETKGLTSLTITGEIVFLDFQNQLPEIHQTKLERDAYLAELDRLRTFVNLMRGTKAYRAIEGLRRVRNRVKARAEGTRFFKSRHAAADQYGKWLQAHSPSQETLRSQRLSHAGREPLLSLLMPAYRTNEPYLRAMIDSVLAQTYERWELCIADGSEDGSLTELLLSYADADPRIRVQTLEKNLGISGNTNAAAKMASGDYYVLVDHDDLLCPDALYEIARGIVGSGAQVLYTDEDKVNMEGTEYFDPNLKPDFSPDLLRSHNYITHLFAVSGELFRQVGGFRSDFDGAQDYDLILRCCEQAQKIKHIPRILYHWRCHPDSTAENPKSKLYAYEAGRKAVQEHLARTGLKGKVENAEQWGLLHVSYETPEDPLVSVIIPNQDHEKDLERCVKSLMGKNEYPNLEILIVENGSKGPAVFDSYQALQQAYPQVRILTWDQPFNYAAINNFAARQAGGELLLLLNNDTQLLSPGSIREMAGLCLREDTGCVGAKLLFADNTVQHAGIILGPGGFAGHVFSGIKKDSPGYMMRPLVTCNYSAVTAACLMVRKGVYEEVGGMEEAFAVALNDVDFCLRVRKAGYWNVFTPYALWHHFESLSRGYDDASPEKKARLEREIALFRERWGTLVDSGDPFYNPNFDLKMEPFRLW